MVSSLFFQSSVFFIGSLLYSSITVFLFFTWLIDPSKKWLVRIALLSFGLGPIVLSFILSLVMLVWRGQTDAVYIVTIMAILTVLGGLGVGKWRALWWTIIYGVRRGRMFPPSFVHLVVALCVFVIVAVMFVHSLALPLTSNDALEYAQSARLIYEDRSTAGYPFIDSSVSGGYYGPWSHPLGHVGLLVWGYMVQGGAAEAGVIKYVGPIFGVATIILLWGAVGGVARIRGALAALLLIVTPLYYVELVSVHIDPIRVYAFFAAIFAVLLSIQRPTPRVLVFTGIAIGLGLYTHSIGVLLLPIFGFLYILRVSVPLKRRLFDVLAVMVIAVFMVAPQLVVNLKSFGFPIADAGAVPVWSVESLDYDSYFQSLRGLNTTADRVVYGIFKGFSKVTFFGASYWFFLLALFLYWIPRFKSDGVISSVLKWYRRPLDLASISLSVCFLFWSMLVLSVVLGLDAFIKNDRYLMTIQPLIVLSSVLLLTRRNYQRERHGRDSSS